MTITSREQQIQKLMTSLEITREEAIQVIEDDERIDAGEAMEFDLSPEQEKVAKDMRRVRRAVDAYGKKRKVKKKEDPTKTAVIAALAEWLESQYTGVEVTNPTKTIDFTIDGESYTFMLTRHRKK